MRRRGGVGADLLAVTGAFLLLGVLAGVLWWLLVEPAEVTRARGGAGMGELELSRRFAADGWYSVLGLLAGLLAGVVLTWWRSRDHLVTTLLLLPGAGLAAAVMALVGGALGPDDTEQLLAAAAHGTSVPVELAVTALPSYLTWPIGALLGAVMVLWSSVDTGQRATEAHTAEVSRARSSGATPTSSPRRPPET